MKFHLTVESEVEGIVFESSAASLEILLDKFYAFERHNPQVLSEKNVTEF